MRPSDQSARAELGSGLVRVAYWGRAASAAFACFCAGSCEEDRCDDVPRGALEDTPPYGKCEGDALEFQPRFLRLGSSVAGEGAFDASAGDAAGNAGDAATQGPVQTSARVAVIARSGSGAARDRTHVWVRSCGCEGQSDHADAGQTSLLALSAVNDRCTPVGNGLRCRTDTIGVAELQVGLGQQARNAHECVCASFWGGRADGGPSDGKPTAAVASLEASLTVDVVTPANEVDGVPVSLGDELADAGLGGASSPIEIEAAAPQLDCDASCNRTRSKLIAVRAGALPDGGVGPALVGKRVSVRLSVTPVRAPSDAQLWLSASGSCEASRSVALEMEFVAPSTSVTLCSNAAGGDFKLEGYLLGASQPSLASRNVKVTPVPVVQLARVVNVAADGSGILPIRYRSCDGTDLGQPLIPAGTTLELRGQNVVFNPPALDLGRPPNAVSFRLTDAPVPRELNFSYSLLGSSTQCNQRLDVTSTDGGSSGGTGMDAATEDSGDAGGLGD